MWAWIVIFLALLGALIPIDVIQGIIRALFPNISNSHIDRIRIIVALLMFIFGVFGLINRFHNENELKSTIEHVKKDNEEASKQLREIQSPSIEYKKISENKFEDNLYVTEYELNSKFAIPNVHFEASAKTISAFNVDSMPGGGGIIKNEGQQNGVWFMDVPNFLGTYQLIVRTKISEAVNIKITGVDHLVEKD